MTINTKHKFVSAKADSTDASVVRPSNWNDVHVITLNGQRLMGRATTGEGPVEEILIGTGLQLSAGTLSNTGGGNAATLGGQAPAYYTDIVSRLGYTPVRNLSTGNLISLQWNGRPVYVINSTSIELANTTELNSANNTAVAAYNAAYNAFSALRLVGSTNSAGATNFENFGQGYIVTGYNRSSGTTGQVSYLYGRQLQGYSPSRGWVAATTE